MNLVRSERSMRGRVGGYFSPQDPGELGSVPRVSIADDEAEILRMYASDKHVLEIGTGLGVSTRAMAQSAVRVYTFDIDPWVHQNVWPMLLLEYGNIAVVTHPYEIASVDMAFIDGNHEQASVDRDTQIALAIVKKGGVILYHDTYTYNLPEELANRGLDWLVLPTTFAIGVVQL